MTKSQYTPALLPIIKWAGGKEKELGIISECLPSDYRNYFEPFIGGGSVFLGLPDKGKSFINDLSAELISVYRAIQSSDTEFHHALTEISHLWEAMRALGDRASDLQKAYIIFRNDDNHLDAIQAMLESEYPEYTSLFNKSELLPNRKEYEALHQEVVKSVVNKVKRMKALEKEKHLLPEGDIVDNITGAYMNGLYMFLRNAYNHAADYSNGMATALFVFIRNYCYSGMFRYNSKGEFNVPYGGIGYNRKSLEKKINYFNSTELKSRLSNAEIFNTDFEAFLDAATPEADDFIFLDPPYDTEFSTYAGNTFDRDDQTRLMKYLTERCQAKWMMVIKSTPFILSLYEDKGLHIFSFDKKYRVSFMNRNNRDVQHLMITNYIPPKAVGFPGFMET